MAEFEIYILYEKGLNSGNIINKHDKLGEPK